MKCQRKNLPTIFQPQNTEVLRVCVVKGLRRGREGKNILDVELGENGENRPNKKKIDKKNRTDK